MRVSGLVLTVLLASQVARAQAVGGRVVGADSAVVAGAIVTLLDSTGVPLARALADDQGRFGMRVPTPGRYRFHVRRLGYAPFLDSLVRVGDGPIVERTILLSSAAVSLRGVQVIGEQQCLGADSTAAAFLVWEEARNALMASQLTRAMRAYTMDVELFSNRQSSDAREPPAIRRTLQQLPYIRAFSAPPPEQLVRDGYVEHSTAGDRYHAPDEDVLLSPSFAETHCIKLLPDSGSAGLVRLGFTPLPGRRAPVITPRMSGA